MWLCGCRCLCESVVVGVGVVCGRVGTCVCGSVCVFFLHSSSLCQYFKKFEKFQKLNVFKSKLPKTPGVFLEFSFYFFSFSTN